MYWVAGIPIVAGITSVCRFPASVYVPENLVFSAASVSPVLANVLAVMLASNMESLLFMASLWLLAFLLLMGSLDTLFADFLYFCKLFLASILLLASPMLLASLLCHMFTL